MEETLSLPEHCAIKMIAKTGEKSKLSHIEYAVDSTVSSQILTFQSPLLQYCSDLEPPIVDQ